MVGKEDNLTGGVGNGGLGTLGSLLGELGLTAGSGSGVLGLLGLLGGISSLLLLLSVTEGSSAGSGTDLGLLVALGADGLPGSTDDGTLVLDGAAGALLGNLLRDTLLVHAAEKDGPGDLTGVLALQEQRLGLAIDETERPAVDADVNLTLARVDLGSREGANLNLHFGTVRNIRSTSLTSRQ
jgi:hypothetical protein